MMAERWRDISDDLASSKQHFIQAVALFHRHAGRMSLAESYLEVMAFQHAMQAGYTSFESSLRRLLAFLDEALPQGSDWHAVLLRRVAEPLEGLRPAVLSETLAEAADELLRFRHVAIHSYDRFKERKAAIAVEAAEIFLARIDAEIAAFRAVIDPD